MKAGKEIDVVYFRRVGPRPDVSDHRHRHATRSIGPRRCRCRPRRSSMPASCRSFRQSGADRLAFFQEYLEHEDPLLAQDAYDEFARAPYADRARR